MGLDEYNKKRSFNKTPEPKGTEKKSTKRNKKLQFVIQKHDASHLHYDFRIELFGVMKSWAIPKGPSLNPLDKRLAMMTEDHPISYNTFEGTIPKGNYGAGEVIVWDKGSYEPLEKNGAKEDVIKKGLRAGKITFILNGKKLKGEFSLIKFKEAKNESGKPWMFVKAHDRYASDLDPTVDPRSVISKKMLIGRNESTEKYIARIEDAQK